ncbi:U-box domain-containing protein 25 isoform X2 [Physcomitrium patens]|nr:U-box domain-containing protein 25-like isoform X2 [Physcomitrium patens]|eukprot:XP_024366132.1 U-box domain-containing protein 25-like isoform X2 [Physcomitrella patens]
MLPRLRFYDIRISRCMLAHQFGDEESGGMRNQKQNARLQQAKGQLFICGIFGNCASSVLSPRTPPGSADHGQKTAFVWAANDCNVPQKQQGGDVYRRCERSEVDIPLSGFVPGSPSASEGDNASSSASDRTSDQCSVHARSSIASDASDLRGSDLEELLAEIKVGNCSKMTISSLNNVLGKNCQSSRDLIRSSGVISSLIALLVSSNLAETEGTGGARVLGDDNHAPSLLEESLAALSVLSEEESTTQQMTTPEFLTVVMWHIRKGRKLARENACVILERLSLKEGFKETMGASPGVLEGLNSILLHEKHLKLVKLATRTLLALCLLRENRLRAAEAGAVASILEMLPLARSAVAEKALATLELLSTTEEGKAAIIDHALAVPVLVELILKVSDRGTEYAAGTLSAICSDNLAMQEAAVEHGAPTKLLLLIQSDCTARAKRKANQLLKA